MRPFEGEQRAPEPGCAGDGCGCILLSLAAFAITLAVVLIVRGL